MYDFKVECWKPVFSVTYRVLILLFVFSFFVWQNIEKYDGYLSMVFKPCFVLFVFFYRFITTTPWFEHKLSMMTMYGMVKFENMKYHICL